MANYSASIEAKIFIGFFAIGALVAAVTAGWIVVQGAPGWQMALGAVVMIVGVAGWFGLFIYRLDREEWERLNRDRP